MPELSYIIWGITAGLCAGAVYIFCVKRVCGGFLEKMIAAGCLSEDTALSAADISGKGKTPALMKTALKDGSGFRRMISATGDGRFYIAEDAVPLARKKYGDATSVPVLIGLVALIILFGFAASLLIPELINMVGDVF